MELDGKASLSEGSAEGAPRTLQALRAPAVGSRCVDANRGFLAIDPRPFSSVWPQGCFKFGLYEYFKDLYSNMAGECDARGRVGSSSAQRLAARGRPRRAHVFFLSF